MQLQALQALIQAALQSGEGQQMIAGAMAQVELSHIIQHLHVLAHVDEQIVKAAYEAAQKCSTQDNQPNLH